MSVSVLTSQLATIRQCVEKILDAKTRLTTPLTIEGITVAMPPEAVEALKRIIDESMTSLFATVDLLKVEYAAFKAKA